MKNLSEILKYTKKMTLLYVEDNKEIREQTKEIFVDLFGTVLLAEDGEEGLNKFYENKIDLVITDINMPKLNGLEMIEKISKFDENIPVMISSAHNETEYFTKAIELNVDGYLLKPLNLEIFLDRIEAIVKKLKFHEEFENNLTFLHQYQDLTDSNTAVSKTNTKGVITYVNEKFCTLSGYDKEELIGQNHNIVRHKDTPASIYADIWHCIKHEKEQWSGVLKNKTKLNKIYYADVSIKPILNSDDEVVEYISLKRDVTNMINPEKQLYDFVESATHPLLVLIKTYDFTDIEKFYGYSLSHEINEKFATKLFSLMPSYLNFTKFLILENGEYAFIQDIQTDIEDFKDTLTSELKFLQNTINELKIDVGEIEYDIAVMLSFSSGKDCIENVNYGIKFLKENKQDFILANDFASKEQKKAENNLHVLKQIKIALDNSKIISYFQPIVCNKTQEVVKYESLVRLVDEDGKVLAPFFFLDIAKKGKYYTKITGMVLENSFKALVLTDKSITINISALDIEKVSTREQIFALLESHKTLSHRIVFELLEDEDVRDIEQITKFISAVKEYGVKIAIDDFGAGYSNFERLLKYQPDILKIDGSLIKNIETDHYSLSVVKTIVAFAKEQKIEMVAEYIENENIYNILNSLGVEYSQGYYFGKPDVMQ